MLSTERLDYSAISERRPLALPDGARLAVWVIVNVEEWDINETMPRTVLTPPAGGSPMPDIPNWAWHEYGNRVGFWRMVEVFDDLRVPAVLAINGSAIGRYGAIAQAARQRNWEFIGHGFSQKNMQKVADERDDIRRTGAAIREATGKAPRGWLGPGLTETWETPDLLAEEGYDYVCDWVLDDQPVVIQTAHGPMVSVPYTVEMNDIAMMALQNHPSEEWLRRGIDTFDRLYQDGEKTARVMAISVHPYITGAPHRIGYLEKLYEYILAREGTVLWTGEQILDWYLKERPARRRRKKAK